MDPLLSQELTPAGQVLLGGKTYPLRFRMREVLLYRQETAKLDRARKALRPALTSAELEDLRRRKKQLAKEASRLRPSETEWTPEVQAQFEAAIDDVTSVRDLLDQEAGAGDSLLERYTWWRIGAADPDRLVLALWVGLHDKNAEGTYASPFSIDQLQEMMDPSNSEAIAEALARALASYLPKPPEPKAGAANPSPAETPNR